MLASQIEDSAKTTAGDSQFTHSQVPHWLHLLSERQRRRPLSVPEKPPDTASTWKGHETYGSVAAGVKVASMAFARLLVK